MQFEIARRALIPDVRSETSGVRQQVTQGNLPFWPA